MSAYDYSQFEEAEDVQMDESGGFDRYTLPEGKANYYGRVRSIINLGQCFGFFKGKKTKKANNTLGVVIEVWHFKEDPEDEDELILANDEPAILYGTLQAKKGGKQASTIEKWQSALGAKTTPQMIGKVAEFEIYVSDKGYMYLNNPITKAGRYEKGIVPDLTSQPMYVPSLNKMTTEALMELNSMTQISDFMLEAENFEGSVAEELIFEIREENETFAVKKAKDDAKGSDKADEEEADEEDKPKRKPKAKRKPVEELDEEEEF